MVLFNFLSVYEGSFEKKVDRFLGRPRIHSPSDLQTLMQEDLVRLTIFMEYKFKGYKKLKKRYRKQLYKWAEQLRIDFLKFVEKNEFKLPSFKKQFNPPAELRTDPHFDFLLLIMAYLKPGRILTYQAATSFEKLIRNPHSKKLVGDCNQIVTLYTHFFSLRYPVSELKVKILPDHICLHYRGQDIETTSGRLTHYPKYTFIAPITEIVSSNLLDIPDPSEKQFKISPSNLLKSAKIAHQFSSHRQTVEKNLLIAYQHLALHQARLQHFEKAKHLAKQSGNKNLEDHVFRMEAIHFLKRKQYKKAASCFRQLNDPKSEKACFQQELSDLLKEIQHFKSLSDYKKEKSKLKKIKTLALKVDKQKIVDFINDLFRKF